MSNAAHAPEHMPTDAIVAEILRLADPDAETTTDPRILALGAELQRRYATDAAAREFIDTH